MNWVDVPDHSGDVLAKELSLAERYDLLNSRLTTMRAAHGKANHTDASSDSFRQYFLPVVAALNSIAQEGYPTFFVYGGYCSSVMRVRIEPKFELELGLAEAAKANV